MEEDNPSSIEDNPSDNEQPSTSKKNGIDKFNVNSEPTSSRLTEKPKSSSMRFDYESKKSSPSKLKKKNSSKRSNENTESTSLSSDNVQTVDVSNRLGYVNSSSIIEVPVENICIEISSDESGNDSLATSTPKLREKSQDSNKSAHNKLQIFETDDGTIRYIDKNKDFTLGTSKFHRITADVENIGLDDFLYVYVVTKMKTVLTNDLKKYVKENIIKAKSRNDNTTTELKDVDMTFFYQSTSTLVGALMQKMTATVTTDFKKTFGDKLSNTSVEIITVDSTSKAVSNQTSHKRSCELSVKNSFEKFKKTYCKNGRLTGNNEDLSSPDSVTFCTSPTTMNVKRERSDSIETNLCVDDCNFNLEIEEPSPDVSI